MILKESDVFPQILTKNYTKENNARNETIVELIYNLLWSEINYLENIIRIWMI